MAMSSMFKEELFERYTIQKEAIEKGGDELYKEFLLGFKREYSQNNKIMVYIQNPKATEVYWFHSWKAQGRMVKKWEKAIYVFAYNEKDVEDKKTGDIERKKFFGVQPVFDISQTESNILTPKPNK